MSSPNGFTDSTDWLNTPLSTIAPLDAALRCQVCKDFFTTPMITSCSHTFCSLCIRRYLLQEGRCPACREPDQEIKLRSNWSVEEAVTQFKAGRDALLNVARNLRDEREEEPRPVKRRKVEHSNPLPERRSTRSHTRKYASVESRNGHNVPSSQEEIRDSDEGSAYEEKVFTPQKDQQPHDGLVACPICARRMKETAINLHLDKCMAGEATPPPRRSDSPQIQPSSIAYGQTKPTQAAERLPTLNYSMLNDNALRRKFKELGIPNHGSKELMRRRHMEWINLWNANCDSLKPVTKQQLLKHLDKWEKTLGRQIDRGPSGVMIKEFDRDGWQKTNKNEFDDLIRQAREKRVATALAKVEQSQDSGSTKPEEPLVPADLSSVPGIQIQSRAPKSLEAIFTDAQKDSYDERALDHNGYGEDAAPMDPTGDQVLPSQLHKTDASMKDAEHPRNGVL